MIGSDALQIGTLTLRKLRDLEKESGMTGSKEGSSARKAEPREEVRPNPEFLTRCTCLPCLIPLDSAA